MGFSILARNSLCSLMICWLLLVPAGVPVLVSFLLSSFFPQERVSVPSWFAGSSWFRLGFRCLSPFFSLLSFLRKGFLFHHDLLVPLGSGWGCGACLPSSLFFLSSGKGFCSIMIYWFLPLRAGDPVLVSLLLPFFLRKGLLFHHDLLVPPSSGWGSGACLPSLFFLSSGQGSVPSWFAGSSWFRLGFRCLSPFFSLLSFLRKGFLFHHDLLIPLGSGWGSGACLLSSLFFLSSGKGFCSIMICWFLLVPAGVPVLVSLLLSSFFPQARASVPSWFTGSSLFGLGIRCLSPFFSLFFLRKGLLFHHDLLVPPSSGWGSGACLPSFFFLRKGLLFHHGFPGSSCFRLGFRCLSPFFSLCSFLRKGILFLHGFPGSSCFGLGFRCLSPFFSLLSFLNRSVPDSSMNFELHMTLVETCVVAVWGLCWCNICFYLYITNLYLYVWYIYIYELWTIIYIYI